MCICVNCRHIQQCQTYIFIEKQHKNINDINKNIKFIPNNTLIQINILKKNTHIVIDWDLIECSSFIEKPGLWYY
uniref:Ycf34 n=1 Tax=Dipterocladia arabiensis TaxID=2007176 RepID=A0A1Z1M0R2_9FLOR|nr:hypothetical protein [Dipterocladia arabiensis]ARW59355.1 hypothetical protein [Dipterocladia arabiensis]